MVLSEIVTHFYRKSMLNARVSCVLEFTLSFPALSKIVGRTIIVL